MSGLRRETHERKSVRRCTLITGQRYYYCIIVVVPSFRLADPACTHTHTQGLWQETKKKKKRRSTPPKRLSKITRRALGTYYIDVYRPYFLHSKRSVLHLSRAASIGTEYYIFYHITLFLVCACLLKNIARNTSCTRSVQNVNSTDVSRIKIDRITLYYIMLITYAVEHRQFGFQE